MAAQRAGSRVHFICPDAQTIPVAMLVGRTFACPSPVRGRRTERVSSGYATAGVRLQMGARDVTTFETRVGKIKGYWRETFNAGPAFDSCVVLSVLLLAMLYLIGVLFMVPFSVIKAFTK